MSATELRVEPILGAGIGLRAQYVSQILHEKPQIAWLEILADNYFHPGGLDILQLDQLREHYSMTLHSVGLSLGSTDQIDREYLKKIKSLVDRYHPSLISEHLCWTSFGGHHLHDLLPLPYTEEAIAHVSQQIAQVQDFLGRQILVENVSSYISYQESEMPEWEFLDAVSKRADCFLLLDLNNVFVSSNNHGFDSEQYLAGVPQERVRELHLGGFEDRGSYLLDAHNSRVAPPVWDLFRQVIGCYGAVPTLIEWDNDLPALELLLEEASKAARVLNADEHAFQVTANV